MLVPCLLEMEKKINKKKKKKEKNKQTKLHVREQHSKDEGRKKNPPQFHNSHWRIQLAHAQNVLDAVERNLDDLKVDADRQNVAHGADAALAHNEADLVVATAGRGVADRPRRLLARLEVALGQALEQLWHDVGVQHRLQRECLCM